MSTKQRFEGYVKWIDRRKHHMPKFLYYYEESVGLYFVESYVEQYGNTMAERLQQKYGKKLGRVEVGIAKFKIEYLRNKIQRSIYLLDNRYAEIFSFFRHGECGRAMVLTKN